MRPPIGCVKCGNSTLTDLASSFYCFFPSLSNLYCTPTPEDFIAKVIKLILEAKSDLIVDGITYHQIDGKYDDKIFTAQKPPQSFEKAFQATKHIQDYVFTDGLVADSTERRFAESLDSAKEVFVYAKLPRSYQIPTPVGYYSPDWAIMFNEGMVTHIYFLAETKGSTDGSQLRAVERAKIKCAKKLFNDITTSTIRFAHVDSYQNLLDQIPQICIDASNSASQ